MNNNLSLKMLLLLSDRQKVFETVNVNMPNMVSHVLTSYSVQVDFSCNYSVFNFPTCTVDQS